MQSPGQLLFSSNIPLFSKLAENSTFAPIEQVTLNLYRFNWSEVNAGRFMSEVLFFAVGFLLLSLALGYGKQFANRGFLAMLLRAGRVWGSLWCGVAAICLIVGAIDLSRLPVEPSIAALWTVILAITGAGLFALCLTALRSRTPGGPVSRKSEIIVRASGAVIAIGCASLLHIVDFPPQTALGYVLVTLVILGVPAGVGFLLPNRGALNTDEKTHERELKGARYFGPYDLVLFVIFCALLIISGWVVPELNRGSLMPLVQGLLLSVCLFNSVPESEIKLHSRSLFGNVLSAWIFLQITMPLGMLVLFSPPGNVPIAMYLVDYMIIAFAGLIVALILSLRVFPKGEEPRRSWWKKSRFWIIAVIGTLLLCDVEVGPAAMTSSGPFSVPMWAMLVFAAIATLIAWKRDLRRPVRFVLLGGTLAFSVLGFALSRIPDYAMFIGMNAFVLPPRYPVIILLVLFLVVLRFRKPAEAVARALRSRPARVAVYSLLIAVALLWHGLRNYPSYALGSLEYSSPRLTEKDLRALSVLPPETGLAHAFLQQSTFDDLAGARETQTQVWTGIFPAPTPFPKLFGYVPQLMGQPSQFVVGAAKLTGASTPSAVRLDVLYSRRVIGNGLADHIRLQLTPNRIREQALLELNSLKQADNWQAYIDYPLTALVPTDLCRPRMSLIEAVVDMAIFSLLNTPGHEALKHLWRLEGLPGVRIY